MKIEGWLFALGAMFYFAVAGAYWFFSGDEIGTTALVMTGTLAFLVSFYMLYTSKRVFPRPEDLQNAYVEDADPEYGFFSPHSWWPLGIGVSAFFVVLGLIFAVWLVVLGILALVFALVGWLFEYYRGAFAH